VFEPPLLVRIGVGELVPALIRFSMEPSTGLFIQLALSKGRNRCYSCSKPQPLLHRIQRDNENSPYAYTE
jgi:hypothetical protein